MSATSANFLLSEVAGKKRDGYKNSKDQFPEVAQDSEKVRELMGKIKQMENEGYSFEGAEGSFESVREKKSSICTKPTFRVVHYRISGRAEDRRFVQVLRDRKAQDKGQGSNDGGAEGKRPGKTPWIWR